MADDLQMPNRLELTLPADAASVAPLRHRVTAFARACGVRDDAAVGVAVSEAITNAVVHGYAAGEAGAITVEAFCDADFLRVTVTDDGGGMKPRPDSPGLGLGLPLMAQLTDGLDVATREGGGTEICLRFSLTGTWTSQSM